jgi:hypothetical protein
MAAVTAQIALGTAVIPVSAVPPGAILRRIDQTGRPAEVRRARWSRARRRSGRWWWRGRRGFPVFAEGGGEIYGWHMPVAGIGPWHAMRS